MNTHHITRCDYCFGTIRPAVRLNGPAQRGECSCWQSPALDHIETEGEAISRGLRDGSVSVAWGHTDTQ
jgi:hypothetical protein